MLTIRICIGKFDTAKLCTLLFNSAGSVADAFGVWSVSQTKNNGEKFSVQSLGLSGSEDYILSDLTLIT